MHWPVGLNVVSVVQETYFHMRNGVQSVPSVLRFPVPQVPQSVLPPKENAAAALMPVERFSG
jgi:hypothetical protein